MSKNYPSKILLAWGEAISGNKEITKWLTKNGYPELSTFCVALQNRDSAKKWLIENGYPHLLALINGAEGDPEAINWLRKNGFEMLSIVAKAGDGDKASQSWLNNNDKLFAVIAHKIYTVKNGIEKRNNNFFIWN